MPRQTDALRILCVIAIALALQGCPGLIGATGLRMMLVRGGAAEASVSAASGAFGGEALAATRAAQMGMASVLAVDSQLLRAAAANSMRLQLGEGAAAVSGRAALRSGNINVTLAEGGTMRVTPLFPARTGGGSIASHYVGTRQVGYSRYSADRIRVDFFVRDAGADGYTHMMYALRDPAGRSVAFFGRNHRYLGKATYRVRSTDGVAKGVAHPFAIISVADFLTSPTEEQCSPQLIIIRRTYFNQGVIDETPRHFWQSFYKDCGSVPQVSIQYQAFRLREIRMMEDLSAKRTALLAFVSEFPQNSEAPTLLELLNRRIANGQIS